MKMKAVALTVDGTPLALTPAYTAIVRSNPQNTFTGWYADLTSLEPDANHTFELHLPPLAPGQFQGLFLDTVETEYTGEIARPDAAPAGSAGDAGDSGGTPRK